MYGVVFGVRFSFRWRMVDMNVLGMVVVCEECLSGAGRAVKACPTMQQLPSCLLLEWVY
jgi:hypothetical protein